jgi:CRISPR-associated endonuclease/helicase Cas3
MIPSEFLKPILSALQILVDLFSLTIVFCTATQPALAGTIGSQRASFEGIKPDQVRELMQTKKPNELTSDLKRVNIHFPKKSNKAESWNEIADKLIEHKQILCVVNSRKDCRDLYSLMPVDTIHLSALMCGQHRSEVIQKIKERLSNEQPIRVISTQLIEAGVDFDFPVVYRALAGFDSIAQAAGRCNREGKNKTLGDVIVFVPPRSAPPGLLRKGAQATQELLSDIRDKTSLLEPETFHAYFRYFYNQVNDFDMGRMYDLLVREASQMHFQFRTAAMRFQLIQDGGQRPVIVQWGKGVDLIEQLRRIGSDQWILRKLQRYTVNIPERVFESLKKETAIEDIHDYWIQRDPGLYHQTLGFLGGETTWHESLHYV